MTSEELDIRLTRIETTLNRLVNLEVTIGRALHIIKATPEQEKAIQIAQREAIAQTNRINHELNVLENKPEEGDAALGIQQILEETPEEVYQDIIGGEYFPNAPVQEGK